VATVHICLSQKTSASMTTLQQTLAGAGIESQESALELLTGPALVFFEEVTDALEDMIRRVSRSGIERVLAVGLQRSALADGSVWRILASGASDVLIWDDPVSGAGSIAARLERWDAVDRMVDSPVVRENLIGRSPAWISLLRQIVEIAHFSDASVLVVGESGTGKELLARLIHKLDARPNKRELVLLDCTTIVPELSGTEFFGHERGAFTGAVGSREGAFALADGGTLFLDEIGELPLKLQAELLRVVQERTYKALGSNTWRNTKFRLVSATNRDLHEEETAGRFRRDFYYRIASHICRVPALWERADDIIPLAQHFLKRLRPNEEPPGFDAPVREYLLSRAYRGNVRDLQQLVMRMSHRHVGGGPITVGDIPMEERSKPDSQPHNWHDPQFESAIIRAVLTGMGLRKIAGRVVETAVNSAIRQESGNLKRAAKVLGITERALQMRRASSRRSAISG
jgi:transcriptional regulator with GAF, ATPase, and Fis domain